MIPPAARAVLASLVLLLCVFVLSATLVSAEFPRYTYASTSTPGAGSPRVFPDSATILLVRDDDNYTPHVQIGFAFTFFGVTYTNVTVGTNGNLQFETLITSTIGELPTALAAADDSNPFWPLIAAYWVDLDSRSSGNMTAATLGTAPNRVFVVRYDRVPYYNDAADTVTFDVELYESSNVIQLHYYNMHARGSEATVTIGVCGKRHGDFTLEQLILANEQTLNSTAIAQINGTTLTLAPSSTAYVSSAPAPTRSARGAYNTTVAHSSTAVALPALPNGTSVTTVTPSSSSNLVTLPLGMTFSFYGVNYTSVVLHVLGALEFVAPSTAIDLPTSIVLPINTTNNVQPLVAFALAEWNVRSGIATSNITYATVVTNDTSAGWSRSFHLRYNAVPHSNSPDQTLTCEVVLFESNSSIEVRYVSMPLTYASIVVGMQSPLVAPNATSATDQYEYAVVANNNLLLADSVSNYFTSTVVRFSNCTGIVCSDPAVVGPSNTSDAMRSRSSLRLVSLGSAVVAIVMAFIMVAIL